jgi:hypothetical protein
VEYLNIWILEREGEDEGECGRNIMGEREDN